jgi:hypothetical protein
MLEPKAVSNRFTFNTKAEETYVSSAFVLKNKKYLLINDKYGVIILLNNHRKWCFI